MIIFAKKHFSQKNASVFSVFINIAIYLRASISIARRFAGRISLVAADAVLLYFTLILVKRFWEKNESIGHGAAYPHELLIYIFPVYVILWILGIYLLRGYSRPYNLLKIFKGVLMGSILISIFYAFLDESLRFSRAIIIIGSAMAFIVFMFNRYLFHFIRYRNFSFQKELRIAIIGSAKDTERVANLLKEGNLDFSFLGYIGINDQNDYKNDPFIGNIDQLEEIIQFHKITELIFCSKDIPSHRIIHIMTKIRDKDIIYKIAPEESLFVIGSNNKNEPGDFYTINIKLSISTPQNKLNKRILDITASLVFLITGIFLMWFQQSNRAFFNNMFKVLTGRRTMVGYETTHDEILPEIRPGILSCIPRNRGLKPDEKRTSELNLIYARDYSVIMDIRIIFRSINKLG
jgi:hypothetical protein